MTNHRERLESLAAAWRAGDALRAAAAFSPEASYREVSSLAPIVGRDAILAHFIRFFRDGPAFEFDLETIVVEGDVAAVAYRFALLGPSGRAEQGCALVRFADGTITQWREYRG